jgi:integrase
MDRRKFGSLRRLASGAYQARYHNEGRDVSKTFPRAADANAWLSAAQTDINRGAWLDPAKGARTLEDFVAEWLEGRRDLRPTTRTHYTYLLNRYIFPELGASRLAAIQPSTVRAWFLSISAERRSTASDAYRLLQTVLRAAVTDGLIAKTPATVKGAGTVKAAERPTASIAEVTAAAEAAPERWRAAILLAAWCQLRRGEALGLQRRHVNPLAGTVTIDQSHGVEGIGAPKTDAGKRTLSVPSNVLPALEAHLEQFTGPDADAWLFPGASGDGPATPRAFDYIWATARKKINRPDLHLHDLRHSGLTWSAATGATVAELMHRGGHASPMTALRYQHATADRDKALADALAGLAAAPVPLRPAVSGR